MWVFFVGHVSNAKVCFLTCMLTGLGCFKRAMWCWRWAKRVCSIGRWIGSSLGSWASLVCGCMFVCGMFVCGMFVCGMFVCGMFVCVRGSMSVSMSVHISEHVREKETQFLCLCLYVCLCRHGGNKAEVGKSRVECMNVTRVKCRVR